MGALMLKIICFKWRPQFYYRSKFDGESVNILRNMVRRNLKIPHEFICITDDATGISTDIKTIPLWESPVLGFGGIQKPNCYARIKAFSKEMAGVIGDRFCWLDLDCVITGDITSLLSGDETFRIWEATNPKNFYNGSMVLMDAGARQRVWQDFDPNTSPQAANNAGFIGSDQAWICHKLGNGEALFTREDGVFTYREVRNNYKDNYLPPDSKIIFFTGKFNPWDIELQNRHSWIKRNYF